MVGSLSLRVPCLPNAIECNLLELSCQYDHACTMNLLFAIAPQPMNPTTSCSGDVQYFIAWSNTLELLLNATSFL